MLALARIAPGFDPRGVMVVELTLPASRYPTMERRAAFVDDLLRRTRARPLVRSASVVSNQFRNDDSRHTAHGAVARASVAGTVRLDVASGAVVALVVAVALLATLAPVWRVTRVPPAAAMREGGRGA